MSITLRLAAFLVALACVVVCAALVAIGAHPVAIVGIVSGTVSVGMAIARPYVFRDDDT